MALAQPRAALDSLRVSLHGARLALYVGKAIAAYEAEEALAPRPDTRARAKRRLGEHVLRGAGFSVEVVGAVPRGGGGKLVVANHRSAFDIAVLLALVPDAVLLSRADIADWPFFGELAKRGDTLFVDRADKSNGARAVRSMRRVLEEGRSLCVFPEGTTHAEPTIRPFQGGAFAAARGLPIEVVPVGIAYSPGLEFVQKSMRAHLENVLLRDDRRVSVEFGAPIPFGHARREDVVRESEDAVRTLFERATKRLAR